MSENQECLYFDEKARDEIAKEINGKPFVVCELALNIGEFYGKCEASTLSDEPEIYADNEADREALRSCYYD